MKCESESGSQSRYLESESSLNQNPPFFFLNPNPDSYLLAMNQNQNLNPAQKALNPDSNLHITELHPWSRKRNDTHTRSVQTWVRSRSRLWLHEAGSQASGSRLWLPDFKKAWLWLLAVRKPWLRLWLRVLQLRFSVVYYPTCEFMLEWHVLLSVSQKIHQNIAEAHDRQNVQLQLWW